MARKIVKIEITLEITSEAELLRAVRAQHSDHFENQEIIDLDHGGMVRRAKRDAHGAISTFLDFLEIPGTSALEITVHKIEQV
jgi:hypothetical protein